MSHEMGHEEVIDAFDADVPAGPTTIRRVVNRYLPAIGLFIIGLGLWQALVITFNIQTFLLPKPTLIFTTFLDEFSTVSSAGWFTFKEALGGFLIGSALGVGVAMATARWTMIREGAVPFAIAVNSMPIIALAPIANQWFGITSAVSKMAVVAVIVFFPVMINMVRGLTEVDPSEIELMRSYAAPGRDVVRKVRFPNALPYLFSALKVASALSVIAAIVSEYFGGTRDALGVYITQQAALFHFAEAWAAIVVGTILGVAFYSVILVIERLVMPWHVSLRASENAP